MIERNLGKTERGIRLVLAVVLAGWVASRPAHGLADAVAVVAALALLWNGIFARCYLWSWLGLSTQCESDCKLRDEDRPSRSRV